MSKFEFSPWCEANGISPKTAVILKDQDLNVEEALKLLTTLPSLATSSRSPS